MAREIEYQKDIYVSDVRGRYITNEQLSGFFSSLGPKFHLETIGTSVRNRPINNITFGDGPRRILMWSQMHGNESTTTKALIDLLRFLNRDTETTLKISDACTLSIVPILNPDGAKAYTRVNDNQKDLNRDAQDLSQPESRVLHSLYTSFQPHFCFNLHDQRTIFNVGTTKKPATVSFLAPAFDEERNTSASRNKSMQLIAAMNRVLQELIPGQVGRYDDAFNPNCVGDAFQMKGTPTILFEAGHYPRDYEREKTREFIFYALLKGINTIANDEIGGYKVDSYLSIPENGKHYVDVLVQNVKQLNLGKAQQDVIPVQYTEVLHGGKIDFVPERISVPLPMDEIFGHKVVDCTNENDVAWLKETGILKLLS